MSKSDAEFEKLRKQAKEGGDQERYPAYKFQEPDVLEGTVIRIDKVMTGDGNARRLIVVEDRVTKDRYTVWVSNKMLIDLVEQWMPAPGDLIVIDFLGKFPVQSDPSREFSKFDMAVGYDTEYEDSKLAWDRVDERFDRKNKEFASRPDAPTAAEKRDFDQGPDMSPF